MDAVFVSDADPDPIYEWWIKELQLVEVDRDALCSGSELTENIVNAAQDILSKQFSKVGGLQDTACAHYLNFRSVFSVHTRFRYYIQVFPPTFT